MARANAIAASSFNPRTPRGVRLFSCFCRAGKYKFQSTHPSRGATAYSLCRPYIYGVSIHAPLAGCDRLADLRATVGSMFQSTHPSRGATHYPPALGCFDSFQSTHPSRGATCENPHHIRHTWCFNPRTPRGVRLIGSIIGNNTGKFQSTHPSRGATEMIETVDGLVCVSIHAPLAGCDLVSPYGQEVIMVSIHAPLAGCDPAVAAAVPARDEFQSTHPSRGATPCVQSCPARALVSIHAPLAGCDGKRSHKGNILPRIYGCYSPQIRFFSAVRPTPLLWHGSSAYILSCDFLFTSPSRS